MGKLKTHVPLNPAINQHIILYVYTNENHRKRVKIGTRAYYQRRKLEELAWFVGGCGAYTFNCRRLLMTKENKKELRSHKWERRVNMCGCGAYTFNSDFLVKMCINKITI